MEFTDTGISGLKLIASEPHQDARGSFSRSFCAKEFGLAGLPQNFVQGNLSVNPHRHTLRGFHFQLPPNGEGKLIRCYSGSLFDVAIDVRPESPTYLCWYGATLTAANNKALYIPSGCAHAFLTLEDNTIAHYLVTEFYTPGQERGIHYKDSLFNVSWPEPVKIISEKDENWPTFSPQIHETEWDQSTCKR